MDRPPRAIGKLCLLLAVFVGTYFYFATICHLSFYFNILFTNLFLNISLCLIILIIIFIHIYLLLLIYKNYYYIIIIIELIFIISF
jgi:hypothetical protein